MGLGFFFEASIWLKANTAYLSW